MSETLQNTKYSLKWASHVVENLWNKYPRATELVCQEYGVTQRKATWLLANHQNRWVRYRKAVKIVDKWIQKIEESPKEEKDFTPALLDALSKTLQSNKLLQST
jgi:hypothetical protein